MVLRLGVDQLGTPRRHRKKPGLNSNNRGARRLRTACQASSSVDDTAKVSKSTRPNIGPPPSLLPSPPQQEAPMRRPQEGARVMKTVGDQLKLTTGVRPDLGDGRHAPTDAH